MQRSFNDVGSTDASTPQPRSRSSSMRKNADEMFLPSHYSPGLLDLHSLDTELLPEVGSVSLYLVFFLPFGWDAAISFVQSRFFGSMILSARRLQFFLVFLLEYWRWMRYIPHFFVNIEEWKLESAFHQRLIHFPIYITCDSIKEYWLNLKYLIPVRVISIIYGV